MPKQTLHTAVAITVQAAGTRPQPSILNTSSVQYQNLLACFPLWVNSATANQVDLKAGLVGAPSRILVGSQDPAMGYVFVGDGTARYFKVPHPAILDFGTPSPQAFSVTVWCKITIPSTSLTNADNPPNAYFYSFDTPSGAFPGHGLAICRNFPDSGTNINAEFDVDSSSAQVSNYGNKKINDGKWHHIACVYACPPGADQNTTGIKGYIYVDGVLDTVSNGSLQDLYYYGVGSIGSSQPMYIGTDDDGATSCFDGMFCDLRFYAGQLPLSTIQAMQANTSTQWELYQ